MDYKNTNPAVLKMQFSLMDKTAFLRFGQELKKELLTADFEQNRSNYRFMLLRLYKWALREYQKRFS